VRVSPLARGAGSTLVPMRDLCMRSACLGSAEVLVVMDVAELTFTVYDLDEVVDEDLMAVVLDELVESEAYTCFAPDSLAEARNRGYRARTV